MKNKKIRMITVATAMAAALAAGGIMAYFTDGDTATNTFTVGKVSIDLQEPNWDPDNATDLTPEEETKKDPQIKNDGVNDAYVFLKVTVPYANVVTASDDGTKKAAADTELWHYDVKDGWTELTAYLNKDTTNKTVTHLYAWTGDTAQAMKAVKAGETTGSLFDWVQVANIVEDQQIETTTQNIKVDAYGIQTDNINDGKDALDGNNADGKTAPAAVWDVLNKQAPTTDVTVPENPKTDIKQ